ncbi:peptidoglycan-binding domain-containing protein [Mesorhizobium sangaii]|uniref:Peptidoglycan hydrolase-like protein with peptidoglycan-binding domain n=1 Tax=Mesorhizobium sangaii TaxID=505389 RepID=A0A841NYY4_9HYPH|nr:peptidoglycan-binding domain-containing protein [Mesorhizobium sangaii]MBB6408176.1 peptidoglycan hydrolase-like protein with peptidoglycan-binding domain [Mesorhizobium sangaii]
MARSAKRPKAVKRRSNAFQDGAVAVGGMISRNPVLVGGSTAFLVTLFYVSANALWYQPFPHAGAFFATRSMQGFQHTADEPETTFNIVRPFGAPAPIKGDPVVEQVQGILKDLDFYSGTVDGISGPNTRKAIEAYQQKVGLNASGEIDALLLDQLGATPKTAAVIPRPQPRPDMPAAVPVSLQTNSGQTNSGQTNTGQANADQTQAPDARIVKIQAGLKAFGNDDMQLDGVVGTRTKAAIKEFQSLFGLPQTGEPDELVYVKMREIGLTN